MTSNELNLELLSQYRSGNQEALNKLCLNNKGLVVAEARKAFSDDRDVDDFLHDGWVGFFEAVKRYRTDCRIDFALFASYYVRGRIRNSISNSVNYGARYTPGDGEIITHHTPFDDIAVVEECGVLKGTVAGLPEDERKVIEALYFDDETQKAVADRLGISRQRVQRLEASALETLREALSE